MHDHTTATRNFLFLQGVASPLFAELAGELEKAGHSCRRINLCAGDRLFWRRPGATNYGGDFEQWSRFLADFLETHRIDELILFGDARPYHRTAIRVARQLGLPIHVFEEGYIRPYWITIDRGGANANSPLPRAAEEYHTLASCSGTPEDDIPFTPSMLKRAGWDIANHAANLLFASLYPHYRSHRPHHPLRELKGWSRRIVRRHLLGEKRRHLSTLQDFLATGRPFFLLPLQLDSDSQIVDHSDFANIGEVMDHVFASFASHAPVGHHLVVKSHPLDNDLVPRGAQTAALTRRYGLEGRTLFVDGGHLPTLLERAAGVVTVNSTIGCSAFVHGCPVKALGRAIYNFPGLTDSRPLDDFWKDPIPPDEKVFRDFTIVVRQQCLIHGSFYCRQGLRLAVQEAARKLLTAPDRSLAEKDSIPHRLAGSLDPDEAVAARNHQPPSSSQSPGSQPYQQDIYPSPLKATCN